MPILIIIRVYGEALMSKNTVSHTLNLLFLTISRLLLIVRNEKVLDKTLASKNIYDYVRNWRVSDEHSL